MKGAGSALYGSLPRRYARALIQVAREEGGDGKVEEFGSLLAKISESLLASSGGPSFLKTLSDENVDNKERCAALEEIANHLGFPILFKNFLTLLVSKERLAILPDVTREYQRFQDEILGILRVTVVTPSQPEHALLERVAANLSTKLKKKVITHGEADPSLIGGIVLRVDHTVYDGSVRKELERIKNAMMAA